MPEDRSLDYFAEGDDGEPAENDSDDSEDEATDSADPDVADPADADPATATSTWHADGAACDRCGDRARRRWREDDDAFVCADCVSW